MSIAFVFVFLVLALPLAVFYIWTLVDALRTPATIWDAAAQNQLLWVGVILFASLLGAILYFLIARPKLIAARTGAVDQNDLIR